MQIRAYISQLEDLLIVLGFFQGLSSVKYLKQKITIGYYANKRVSFVLVK